jgi:hypothetical protein
LKLYPEKGQSNEESENHRDFDLERIVGNMLISQYQAHLLKSKLADGLAGWWVLSQDRDYDSSSFTFRHNGQKFKVSSSVAESAPTTDHLTFMFD